MRTPKEIKDLYPECRNRYYQMHLKELESNKKQLEQNKKDLKAFCIALLSSGDAKEYRAGKVLSNLKRLALWLNKPLRTAKLNDIQALMVRINGLDRREATKKDYVRSLKQYYGWFEEQDKRLLSNSARTREEAKKIYKFLKKVSGKFKTQRINPNEILTEQDKEQLFKGCKTAQEKAIISLLHEIGCRTSEILLTKINGFSMDKRGIGTIFLGDGKSGSRSVDIIKSCYYIQEHLKSHPEKENPDAQLFYFIDSRNNKLKSMNHSRLYKTLKRIAKNSGINKKMNPHWFRHTRASLDAIDGKMSESVRKERGGWSQKSRVMEECYTHLGKKQVRKAFLQANGIQEGNERKQEFINCICQRTIDASLPYCPYCSRPTSLQVVEKERIQAQELQKEISEVLPLTPENPQEKQEFFKTINFAMEMMKNPKLMEEFNKFKKGKV